MDRVDPPFFLVRGTFQPPHVGTGAALTSDMTSHSLMARCIRLAAAAALVASCSSVPSAFDPVPDASVEAAVDASYTFLDVAVNDAACVNLQCAQSAGTTISGVVYDPAGNRPLYDVFVYVPNTTPDPITPGNPVCSQCQAPASGSPVVSTMTDSNGAFVLQDAPSGNNIPLVMQIGKWRRQITIPLVTAGTDNPLTDKNQTRLPAKGSEGDMPNIAFTSGGCDIAECFLRRIGIADSEFVPPGGAGHVHFYTGMGGDTITGGNTPTQTYTWWMNAANLAPYDIVFQACDCSPYERNVQGQSGDAYQAMQTYLNSGGRVFSTHFFYNWYAPETACESHNTCQGPADFNGVAKWCAGNCGQGVNGLSNYYVDTTFPKGQAFGDWLLGQGVTKTPGVISLDETQTDRANDVGAVTTATRWIYAGNSPTDPDYLTKYLTFNTPVGNAPAQQCGRAEFTEFHLDNFFTTGGPFPGECTGDTVGDHANNEAALEFLFFDLSSCVQDDTQPPVQPN